jgi:ankyrin repeat protein
MRNASSSAVSVLRSNAMGALVLTALVWISVPDSPVADAAMRGDLDVVRTLLRGGADVNAAQGDGMTALHWAAEAGNEGMVEALIYAGANLGAVTRIGDYTPLHLASKAGQPAGVAALLEAGADPEARTGTGAATALHFAAAAGNAASLTALLEHGAAVDAQERQWGQTPLMFAAAANRVEAIHALLEGGADPEITAEVIDITVREEEDRVDRGRRNRRLAELKQASTPGSPDVRRAPPAAGPPTSPSREGADPPPVRELPQEVELRGTTEINPLSYADLVGRHGGLTALLLAAREGHKEASLALVEAGADINGLSAADQTSPMLIAAINGHFDLAMKLLQLGADPTLASGAGATPLYAVLNMHWAPKSRHPQKTDYMQQQATYMEVMKTLLDAGVDPNVRLVKPLWYTTYNNDLLRVTRAGATPFWRAAFALDIEAMRMLISCGADPTIPTTKMPPRRPPSDDDASGLPPVPVGGPGAWPIHAASGVGYGEGFAANSHRHVINAWLPAMKYLVEEHGADVNARDENGYTAVHHAAARGDNELIRYLVEQGADVTGVSRRGQTTVDMANGPVQRIQPFPETVALLESFGAINNHNCVSC